jgi:hypothetical protein
VHPKERRSTLGFPQGQIARVQGNRRRRLDLAADPGSASNMVKMSVCQPDGGDAPTAALSGSRDDLPIPGRIDDHRFIHRCIGHNIAVRLDWTQHQ